MTMSALAVRLILVNVRLVSISDSSMHIRASVTEFEILAT